MLEQAQFSFSYLKGYYVYRCNAPGVSNSNILQGNADVKVLSEPLGIVPDYALLSDVEGYDEKGNMAIHRSFTLKLTMTLFDVKEKKPVWTKSTVGISSRSVLGHILTFGATSSEESDELQTVRDALMQVMDNMPVVKGFQGGPGSKK